MSVTVAVPTVGRSASLRRLLEALARQHDPGVPWQVLVVDNATPPSAAELVTSVALPVPVRTVHEPVRGASAARSRAVRETATPNIALLDDDVLPEADWLARLVAAREGADAVAGRVVLDPQVQRPAWLDAKLAGYLTQLDLGPEPRLLADGDYLLTANALFPTDRLAQLGFDPRLGPRAGLHLTNDDLDLTERALAAGLRIAWAPDAVVVHDLPEQRLRLTWLLRRIYWQGRSDVRLRQRQWWAGGTSLAGRLRAAAVPGFERSGWRGPTRLLRLVHVLADAARALGWWREALPAILRPTARERR